MTRSNFANHLCSFPRLLRLRRARFSTPRLLRLTILFKGPVNQAESLGALRWDRAVRWQGTGVVSGKTCDYSVNEDSCMATFSFNQHILFVLPCYFFLVLLLLCLCYYLCDATLLLLLMMMTINPIRTHRHLALSTWLRNCLFPTDHSSATATSSSTQHESSHRGQSLAQYLWTAQKNCNKSRGRIGWQEEEREEVRTHPGFFLLYK